jgi:hypothetical protein
MTEKENFENITDAVERTDIDDISIEQDEDSTMNQVDLDDNSDCNWDDDDMIEINLDDDDDLSDLDILEPKELVITPVLPTYIMTDEKHIEKIIKNVYILKGTIIKRIIFTQSDISGVMVYDDTNYFDYLEFSSLPGKPDTVDSAVLIWWSVFSKDYEKLIRKLDMWGIKSISDHDTDKITDIHEYLKKGSKNKKSIIRKAQKLAAIV